LKYEYSPSAVPANIASPTSVPPFLEAFAVLLRLPPLLHKGHVIYLFSSLIFCSM
jgi:hypothetical protein